MSYRGKVEGGVDGVEGVGDGVEGKKLRDHFVQS